MPSYRLFISCLVLYGLSNLPSIHAVFTSGLSCGALLPSVAAYCGHPTKTDQSNCCDALRTWNDAACWCEPTAFAVVSLIATNHYAFTARASACNITNLLRPQIPSRYDPPVSSTCPESFVNVTADEKDDGDNCTHLPTDLRAMRLNTLNTLDLLKLKSKSQTDITSFKKSLSGILVPTSYFMNIGQIALFGASALTDYFLARQSPLGCTSPLHPSSRRQYLFWRDPSSASYALSIETVDGMLCVRYVFAGFSPCSSQLRALYIAESPYLSAQYAQFFHTKGANNVMGQFDISADTLCSKIAKSCAGSAFPYESTAECVAAMQTLKTAKKVMCNRFKQRYVPQLALHGNSIACRATFAGVAEENPAKYCPLLGEKATGICSDQACPGGLYDDIFTAQNPRHDGSGGGFLCKRSTGICVEQWP